MHNFNVQVETNGTLYLDIPNEIELVCSPKISNSRYNIIRDDVLKQTIAINLTTYEKYSSSPEYFFV